MSQFILPPTEYSSNIFGSNSCKKNILYFLLSYILERDQELWSSCVSDRYKGTNLIKGLQMKIHRNNNSIDNKVSQEILKIQTIQKTQWVQQVPCILTKLLNTNMKDYPMNNCKYCFHLIKRFQRKSKFLKVDMPRQIRHDDYTKNNANTNIKLKQVKYTKALSHTRSKTLLIFIIKCLFRISLLRIYLPPRLWCCLWTCRCKYVNMSGIKQLLITIIQHEWFFLYIFYSFFSICFVKAFWKLYKDTISSISIMFMHYVSKIVIH
jgi:hypothetical protein